MKKFIINIILPMVIIIAGAFNVQEGAYWMLWLLIPAIIIFVNNLCNYCTR